MKPKRIKALKGHINPQGTVFRFIYADTEPCYLIRRSDVRALAEQMSRDADAAIYTPNRKFKSRVEVLLHCFKKMGMAPGRKESAK